MRLGTQHLRQGAALIIALFGWNTAAFATVPPSVTNFSFDQAQQKISFSFNTGGVAKETKWKLISSTGNAQFSNGNTGTVSGSVTGAVAFGNTFGITPGTDPIGTKVTFYLTVSNENGRTTGNAICLVVVTGSVAGTAAFGPSDICVPTLSAWGFAVLTLLVLAAGTIVLARRARFGDSL